MTPNESVHFITKRRPQVFLHTKQWQAIEEYYKRQSYKCHLISSSSFPNDKTKFELKFKNF